MKIIKSRAHENLTVADGQLILLEQQDTLSQYKKAHVKGLFGRIYIPIIISLSENSAQQGDWMYNPFSANPLHQYPRDKEDCEFIGTKVFRVLVLPEQFNEKHLKLIADEKWNKKDMLRVECVKYTKKKKWSDWYDTIEVWYDIKLDENSHAIIHLDVVKMVPATLLKEAFYAGLNSSSLLKGSAREMVNYTEDQYNDWFVKHVK